MKSPGLGLRETRATRPLGSKVQKSPHQRFHSPALPRPGEGDGREVRGRTGRPASNTACSISPMPNIKLRLRSEFRIQRRRLRSTSEKENVRLMQTGSDPFREPSRPSLDFQQPVCVPVPAPLLPGALAAVALGRQSPCAVRPAGPALLATRAFFRGLPLQNRFCQRLAAPAPFVAVHHPQPRLFGSLLALLFQPGLLR